MASPPRPGPAETSTLRRRNEFSTTLTEAQARAVGIHTCLLKPVVAGDLGFAVRRAIDGLPPEDPEAD